MNTHRQDEIYRIVGEEMARQEIHPGPMARAVAEAQGNRDLVQSLYVKFRHEELSRQAEAEQQRIQREEYCRILEREKKGIYACPCGFSGKPLLKEYGSMLLCLMLLCFFLVPSIIYAIMTNGWEKAIYPGCGRTLNRKIRKSWNS